MTSVRKRLRPLLVLVGLVLVAGMVWSVPASAAATIHVAGDDPDCSDAGPGSPTTPLCTVGEGATRAFAGDTVVVASGMYDEQVTMPRSGTASAPIVVTAAPRATVTLRGQTHGFRVASRNWVTIRGFAVVDTASHGIYVTGSSHIAVEDTFVTGAGAPLSGQTARGISLSTTTISVVSGNLTSANSDAGIFLGAGSTGNLVTENTSFDNARGYTRAAAGIDVRAAGATVAGNTSFENEDSGINIWDGATGALVVNNVAYRNGDHGIDTKGSNDVRVIANTVYDSVDSGIEVVGSTGVVVANNISVDNGIDPPPMRTAGNLRVDETSAATISLDHDLVHLSAPGVMVDWRGAEYTSLAAFVAATGQERNGEEGDPLFVAPSSGNLRLRKDSPAIDSADSGVAGHPDTDADGHARVDDPASPNDGTGPRTYDDRGAFEFVPSSK